ncbi:MAG: xanthine dehydrogenase family protein molybdopterin-binding subunit [Sporichthyaceae bacterium]
MTLEVLAKDGRGLVKFGQPLLRREDDPILRGRARFTDDVPVPGALHVEVFRSPHAHARVLSIDTSAAKASPGVVAVFTGAELAEEWPAGVPVLIKPDPAPLSAPEWRPIAVGKVNYVGEPMAVVIAETPAQAVDALEGIVAEFEVLPAVIDLEDAASDRVVIHDELGTNKAYTWDLAITPESVEQAFAEAAFTVKQRHVQQRLLPAPMETRAVCAIPDPVREGYTLYSSTQMAHLLRTLLANQLAMAEQQLRVVAPNVGGGFGSKLQIYPEESICLALARRLKRPVRWVENRSECGVAMIHGRGQVQDIEIAADAGGKITAVRVELIGDLGAHCKLFTPGIPVLGGVYYHGCYDVPNYACKVVGVYTNMPPTDAYRGAGRPEATYAIERAVDELAHTMGMDPAEVRRINFIPAFEDIHPTVCQVPFDSGNYEPALNQALELVGYDELRREQAQRRAAGGTKHLGIGMASYVEVCGYAPSRLMAAGGGKFSLWGSSVVRFLPTGKVLVTTGSHPHGQGHETSWAQLASDRLGVPYEDIEILCNDTAVAQYGVLTGGSRSLSVEGGALYLSCDKVIKKARQLAAHLMEADESDVDFDEGRFNVKGSPGEGLHIVELAYVAAFEAHRLPDGMEPNLSAETTFDPPNFTFPFGTHVVVVEVDEETGGVELLKVAAVDDCGNQLNPVLVHGQVHGGLVQAIGQALFEHAAYDSDGNPLAASFLDYLVPSAAEVPSFDIGSTVTPSPSNPLGTKGVGEAGAIGGAPAVINAICDALAPLGVTNVLMPASPMTVWRTIQEAKANAKENGR